MDKYTLAEQAYSNGFAAGMEEAKKQVATVYMLPSMSPGKYVCGFCNKEIADPIDSRYCAYCGRLFL